MGCGDSPAKNEAGCMAKSHRTSPPGATLSDSARGKPSEIPLPSLCGHLNKAALKRGRFAHAKCF